MLGLGLKGYFRSNLGGTIYRRFSHEWGSDPCLGSTVAVKKPTRAVGLLDADVGTGHLREEEFRSYWDGFTVDRHGELFGCLARGKAQHLLLGRVVGAGVRCAVERGYVYRDRLVGHRRVETHGEDHLLRPRRPPIHAWVVD